MVEEEELGSGWVQTTEVLMKVTSKQAVERYDKSCDKPQHHVMHHGHVTILDLWPTKTDFR